MATGSPDLLRTTLVFKLIGKQVQDIIHAEQAPFDLFEQVKAGRLTDIDEEIQRRQKRSTHAETQKYVNQQDSEGKTPLFYACFYNYQNIVLYLLTKGADPFILDKQGRNIFSILAFKGLTDIINIVKNFYRHTIRKNCLTILKKAKKTYSFLKSDIQKGQLVSPDQTLPSVQANFKKFLPIVEKTFKQSYLDQLELFQQKAICGVDELNRNPLHYSSMAKYTRCGLASKFLLMNEYDKIEGYQEFEALWDELQLLELTAEKREETKSALQVLDLIRNILSEDVFDGLVKDYKKNIRQIQRKVINAQDNDGYTPMHLASFYGDFLSVQFLLRLGGDEHIKDIKDNKPVIDYASNNQVRRVLLDLKEAARRGDVQSFDTLLNSEDKNKIDDRTTIMSIAPIHNAVQHVCKTKNQSILDLIIKCGANLDVSDGSGWTPLHHACQNGDLETVKNLVANEANIHAFSNKHLYPLHIAALNNHAHLITFLAENGADLECQNDEQCTPLLLAAKKGHIESVKTLLDLGADIYALDIRKWNALHYASYNSHAKTVNLLCKYDSDFERLREMLNSQGKTPKEIASSETVKFQFHTIWKAAYDGNLDVLRRLHRFGEDINAQTPIYKFTPLILATQRHHILVVKYLLDNGARRELQDEYHKNAYEYSVEALKLIKFDKEKRKIIDPTKATKNEFFFTRSGKKEYYPDLPAKIEKTYKLFL